MTSASARTYITLAGGNFDDHEASDVILVALGERGGRRQRGVVYQCHHMMK